MPKSKRKIIQREQMLQSIQRLQQNTDKKTRQLRKYYCSVYRTQEAMGEVTTSSATRVHLDHRSHQSQKLVV